MKQGDGLNKSDRTLTEYFAGVYDSPRNRSTLSAPFLPDANLLADSEAFIMSRLVLSLDCERIIRNSSLKTDHSWLYSYLTGISWLVMILSITCSLAVLLYNAVSGFDWTATTVVWFAWKAVVGRSHARAARAPIIFGLQVVIAALKIIVVGPLIVVVAVTLLNKETIVTNISLYSSFRLPSLCIIRIITLLIVPCSVQSSLKFLKFEMAQNPPEWLYFKTLL